MPSREPWTQEEILVQLLPATGGAIAALWWGAMFIEYKQRSSKFFRKVKLLKHPNSTEVKHNPDVTFIDLLHSKGLEGLIAGFITWMGWLHIVISIYGPTNIDWERANVVFSTVHCFLSLFLGWLFVYQRDWSKTHENTPKCAVFCCFTLSYMFADLYIINIHRDSSPTIIFHHFICSFSLIWALCSHYQSQLANTVILYESTGLNFNMIHWLLANGFKDDHPYYIANGAIFFATFAFFRMFLGTWSTWTFVNNWSENRPGIFFKMQSIAFHLLSVYWFAQMCEIVAGVVGVPFPAVNATLQNLPVFDHIHLLYNPVVDTINQLRAMVMAK